MTKPTEKEWQKLEEIAQFLGYKDLQDFLIHGLDKQKGLQIMATTKEIQQAREWALREVIALIGIAQHGQTITFAHNANQFADEKTKSLVNREIDKITWQLLKRQTKTQRAMGI